MAPDDEAARNEIKALRAAGYVPARIAALAGVTRQFFHAVEHGRRPVPDSLRSVVRHELESLGIRPPTRPAA